MRNNLKGLNNGFNNLNLKMIKSSVSGINLLWIYDPSDHKQIKEIKLCLFLKVFF